MTGMAWSHYQAKFFAGQIAGSDAGSAWKMLHPLVKHAIVSEFVLGIVFAQDESKKTVNIEEVRSLHIAILHSLEHDYRMPVGERLY